MSTNKDFCKDIDSTLKAWISDGLQDHYHKAIVCEMVRSRPRLTYVTFKSKILKMLGPNVKPRSITVSKLENIFEESPP